MELVQTYTAVIQAGGKGTRLRELTKDEIPKPLLSLNGKPMIQWQFETLNRYGINEFIFIVGHLGEKIEAYFGDGSKFGVHIQYIREECPLGSAGALYYLKDKIETENFFLIFGDVMFDIDADRMMSFHEAHGAMATLLMHPNSHPYDSDLLMLDDELHVTGIDAKGSKRDYWYENCVNAGIFVLSSQLLKGFDEPMRLELEQDVLKPLMEQNVVYGYRTPEYVKDAGTVDRFISVSTAQKNGIWEQKNLSNKQKCIFLDRDGTVNRYCGLISDVAQLELENGVAEAIRMINESGYLVILITNQPVVARGMCSIDDVKLIHRKLQTLLGEKGAYLDDIIFCPHHPDKGYPEENPKYKVVCNCRKPATGMIDEMVEKYNIDLTNSFLIGDSTVDIMTGINAGLKTILLKTGQAGMDGKYDVKPNYSADNLKNAVMWIIKNKEDIR